MADTLQSLQIELARLRKLIDELRAVGHAGLAEALRESLEKLVSDVAKLTGAAANPKQPVTQQQQQVQPKKEDC